MLQQEDPTRQQLIDALQVMISGWETTRGDRTLFCPAMPRDVKSYDDAKRVLLLALENG